MLSMPASGRVTIIDLARGRLGRRYRFLRRIAAGCDGASYIPGCPRNPVLRRVHGLGRCRHDRGLEDRSSNYEIHCCRTEDQDAFVLPQPDQHEAGPGVLINPPHVRFAPKATEMLHRREMTLQVGKVFLHGAALVGAASSAC